MNILIWCYKHRTVCFIICIALFSCSFIALKDKENALWPLLGSIGLELGAAILLMMIFNDRDKRNEEQSKREEKTRKTDFIKKLIDSCFMEDWAVDFLKPLEPSSGADFKFRSSVYRGYIVDSILQSLRLLNAACLEVGEYEISEKVKDLYINKRVMSDMWTLETFAYQSQITHEVFDMLKKFQKQYNSKLRKIKDILDNIKDNDG